MLDREWQIINHFELQLIRDVIPNEILPYLRCLTEDDREQIRWRQDREGPRAAVPILLERLKKREGAFKQLSEGLGQTGCPHLKGLLQNAIRAAIVEQTCSPEQNFTPMTPETTSESEILKTPTSETSIPFTLAETKQPTHSKKRNKKPNKIPRENTTSPPRSTNYVKLSKTNKSKPNTTSKKSGSAKNPPTAIKCKEDTVEEQTTNYQATQRPPMTLSTIDRQESEYNNFESCHYDTLVCYAKENREIALELKGFLETEYNLKVCMDLFNFTPGKAITDNICESIHSSRSIVFLLSSKFHTKVMGPWELKNAVFNASQNKEKEKMIIPVLLEECEVPDDLKIYTAIKIDGSRKECWRKLAAALSSRSYVHEVENGCNDNADGIENNNSNATLTVTPHDCAQNTVDTNN